MFLAVNFQLNSTDRTRSTTVATTMRTRRARRAIRLTMMRTKTKMSAPSVKRALKLAEIHRAIPADCTCPTSGTLATLYDAWSDCVTSANAFRLRPLRRAVREAEAASAPSSIPLELPDHPPWVCFIRSSGNEVRRVRICTSRCWKCLCLGTGNAMHVTWKGPD